MSPVTDQAIESFFLHHPVHILVATDLTDQELLMPYILGQARESGAFVTLVHAIKPGNCKLLEGCAGCGMVGDAKVAASAALAKMAAAIEAHGVSCAFVVKLGVASNVVMEQIRITGATRLIMTSACKGADGQSLLSSLAKDLFRHAGVPVFIVGPKCKVSPAFPSFGLILHPVSSGGDWRGTVEFAMELARKSRAFLTLLQVDDFGEERGAGESELSELRERLRMDFGLLDGESDPLIFVAVRSGDAVEEIQREVLQSSTDLIVIGMEERSQQWSFIDQIAAVSNCPVLAVPNYSMPPWAKATDQAFVILK